MIDWLSRRPARFLGVMACYFLLNLIVRVVLPHSLELDEAQQSLVSQWIALGYDTQPPFYNWVQYAVITFFGNTVFSLAALKNAFLFATYALYFLTARRLLSGSAFVLVAAFGLLTVPQIVWESQRDLTHSVALNFAAALFLFSYFSLIKEPKARYYVLIGLAAGIGLIAKYNFAILIAAAGIGLLSTPAHRNKVFTPLVLVSALLAFAVVLPHAVWLLDHLAAATSGTLSKLTRTSSQNEIMRIISGLMSIASACAAFAILPTVIFAIISGTDFWRSLRVNTDVTRIIETMILSMVAILVLMVCVTGATSFKDRWLSPILLLLPLYFSLKLEASGVRGERMLGRLIPIVTVIMVLVPMALLLRPTTAAWTGSYQKLNVPYGPFAEKLLAEEGVTPAFVVAADKHLAGNMRHQLPQIPVAAQWYPDAGAATRWNGQMPVLLVWRVTDTAVAEIPPDLLDWLEDNAAIGALKRAPQVMEVPYLYARGQDSYRFGYAWLTKP